MLLIAYDNDVLKYGMSLSAALEQKMCTQIESPSMTSQSRLNTKQVLSQRRTSVPANARSLCPLIISKGFGYVRRGVRPLRQQQACMRHIVCHTSSQVCSTCRRSTLSLHHPDCTLAHLGVLQDSESQIADTKQGPAPDTQARARARSQMPHHQLALNHQH